MVLFKVVDVDTFVYMYTYINPPPAWLQGAVESIAMKTPKERTQLFEQISRYVTAWYVACSIRLAW